MRFALVLKITVTFVVVVVFAIFLFLKTVDFNDYRDSISRQVKSATGQDFVINGDFDIALSLNPILTANDVTLANTSWGSGPERVKLKSLEVEIHLLPLIFGDIEVKSLEARIAENIIKVEGTITNPVKVQGLDLKFSVEGTDLSIISQLTGIPLPMGASFFLAARLTDPEGAYSFQDMDARLGQNHLGGSLWVKMDGRKPVIKADLKTLNLNLDEWTPLKQEIKIQKKLKNKKKGRKRRSAKRKKRKKRIFSNTPFPLQGLHLVNAEIKASDGQILGKGLELKKITLDLSLKNGNLTVRSLTGDLSGGTLSLNAILKTRKSGKAVIQAEAAFKEVDLGPLLRDLQATNLISSGKTDMKVRLRGKGNSMRSLMAGLNGKIEMIMGEGKIEKKYADFIAANYLNLFFPEKFIMINCFVCRFHVKKGRVMNKGLLLDTKEITVTGEGHVNLANETIDLTIRPKPKNFSLLNFAIPVRIRGTLADPSVKLNMGSVLKGFVAASFGETIDPEERMVPLVGKGVDGKNPCLVALQAVLKPREMEKPIRKKNNIKGFLKSLKKDLHKALEDRK